MAACLLLLLVTLAGLGHGPGSPANYGLLGGLGPRPAGGADLPGLLPTLSAPVRALGRALASRLGIRSVSSVPSVPASEPNSDSTMLTTVLAVAPTEPASTPAAAAPPAQPPLAVEATLSADELIRHWGYPSEVHSVQTEDGYILKMYRIPWGREGPATAAGETPRPAVLLQHGLLQSADQWLLRGPGRDLALILADQGYDVWLGNFRGNVYCKRHARMPKDSDKFWAFSWHENGYYDLAAQIDYTLAVSGQPSLFYVGHSMATTAVLVLLSSRPQYNARVRAAALMAPVVYFTHLRGALSVAFPLLKQIERDLRLVSAEVLPRGLIPRSLVSSLCRPSAPTFGLCVGAFGQVAGPDLRQLNATLFTTVLSHLPAGASLGQFVHYIQSWKTGQFRQFDHGVRYNSLRYGQSQPPAYNLTNAVAPLLFFYSTGDYLAHAKDVERLINEVPGTAGVYRVPLKDFNHGDYMWAIDSYELLYRTVLKTLKEF